VDPSHPGPGPSTQVIDLAGRTVIRGLIDSHLPAWGRVRGEGRRPGQSQCLYLAISRWLHREYLQRNASFMTSPLRMPIFDGHNDVLLRLYRRGGTDGLRAFLEGVAQGHLDFRMARQEGGFAGGLFAIFVPSSNGATAKMTNALSKRRCGLLGPARRFKSRAGHACA
jgi:hypothetical protein